LQERGAVLEQQRLRVVQQEKKCDEDSPVDEQQDNKKGTVRIHKVTDEVSVICFCYSSLKT
jgi:hypothetical protein